MHQSSSILLEQQQHDTWAWLTLGDTVIANAQPGQFVAVRRSSADSFDPLLRQPLFIANTNSATNTFNLLVHQSDPSYAFLTQQPRGASIDLLGPLGHGWSFDPSVRSVALLGVADYAAPLFALAHHAVARGVAASLILGVQHRIDAPPPHLLPPAAEYNIAPSFAAASAAIAQLDDQVLRWADLLAIALPYEFWTAVARRVDQVRIRWSRGFAQVAVLHPEGTSFACCVGVCGVCSVETRHAQKLACVDGPIFDLRDVTR